MHKKRDSIALAAASLAVLTLFSLPIQSGQSTRFLQQPNLAGTRGGNLVAAIASDPATFNRMLAASVAQFIVTDRLSADLVHINRANFELEPSLAERWNLDKTGRTYTVHLRRGLRFSDGSPCTADDVLFSLQVLQDPKTGAMLGDQIKIDGVFPVVSKVDNYAVRLTFQRPAGMGLRALDSVPILPRSRLLKAYQDGNFSSVWGPTVAPGEVVGMGPFRLKEYQRGVKVVLERNPYYWKKDKAGQALPYLDFITFLIVPDLNSEALRFQAGELDLVRDLNAENYASLRRSQSQGNYTLRDLGPGLAMDFLWFNLNPGKDSSGKPWVDAEKRTIFEKAEFRRAISTALDREGMTRSILLGLGSIQFGPISSGNTVWYNPGIARTDYNPGRAREMLAQIGIIDRNGDGMVEFGATGRPLEISLFTGRGNIVREKTAQVIRDNLSKIGIRVDIQLLTPNELIGRITNSFSYEAILFRFSPTDVAPDLQTDVWYSYGKNHFWHPNQAKPQTQWEAEMDSLTSRLVRGLDPAARKRAFSQIQEIWAREMPAIPTAAAHILVGWNNRVGNVRPAILIPQLLWNAEELTVRSR